jgi:hypothetical protein
MAEPGWENTIGHVHRAWHLDLVVVRSGRAETPVLVRLHGILDMELEDEIVII